jgi:hypothetical protein
MITIIYGAKGSGKTKRIIDAANDAARTSDGSVVYITDQSKHSRELKTPVRFVDATEYGIAAEAAALGFIKGILASNHDITHIFIDGFARISGLAIENTKPLYTALETLGKKDGVEFVLTVSTDNPPSFMRI